MAFFGFALPMLLADARSSVTHAAAMTVHLQSLHHPAALHSIDASSTTDDSWIFGRPSVHITALVLPSLLFAGAGK
jgi:hypothetical protein